ncbi:hypothetical protein GCM10017691_21050 [Pseudonocardia petroleophila]
MTGADREILDQAAAILRCGALTTTQGQEAIRHALLSTETATALEAALTHVHVREVTPDLFINLRDHVLPDIYRTAAHRSPDP